MVRSNQPDMVLVTGASTGIGRATTLHLGRGGFRVFATVRNDQDAQSLCAEATGEVIPLLMDVTDQASIERAKAQVSRAAGEAGLAGLVNNAGVAFVAPLEYAPLNDFRWVFEVNVFGLLGVTQAFLPLLRQRGGRIVNISSIASIVVAPFHGPYSSSKFALNGLSDALRLELKPLGVQVALVICGTIDTPIWDKAGEASDRVAASYPPEAGDLYGEALKKLRNYFVKLGKAGIQPEAVARQIEHALMAPRAKPRYYVGMDAKFYRILDKLVGGSLRDKLILETIGL